MSYKCPRCHGRGEDYYWTPAPIRCPGCNGTGWIDDDLTAPVQSSNVSLTTSGWGGRNFEENEINRKKSTDSIRDGLFNALNESNLSGALRDLLGNDSRYFDLSRISVQKSSGYFNPIATFEIGPLYGELWIFNFSYPPSFTVKYRLDHKYRIWGPKLGNVVDEVKTSLFKLAKKNNFFFDEKKASWDFLT